jgi:hypothetical protein
LSIFICNYLFLIIFPHEKRILKVCVKEDESYLAALNCFVVGSLYQPIGKKGDERFARESILENPAKENTKERDNGKKVFTKK